MIVSRTSGSVLQWREDRWLAQIEHYNLDDSGVAELKRSIGAFATKAVFGPTQQAVDEASQHLGKAGPLTPGLLEGGDLGCHIYDYFRVLSALQSGPDQAQERADGLDWSAIEDKQWTAPVAVELLFQDRTEGGVRVEGNNLVIDLAYGIKTREKRREAGDFRMGATSLTELSVLRQKTSEGH
jgi:hypothetical protein